MVLALVTDILLDSSAGTNVENIPCYLRKCKAKKRNFIHCWGDDQWNEKQGQHPTIMTPTIPMPTKQMWMAAASSDGQFMKRKHLREFDSVCLHGTCHSMTALIVELMPPTVPMDCFGWVDVAK